MKKNILTGLVAFTSLISIGQQKSSTTALASVNSVDKAKQFIEANPKLEGKLFTISPNFIDTGDLLEPLYQMKPGYAFKLGDYNHKIVGVDSIRSLKVSYIYLDGERLSKAEIDSIRDKIISQYKDGTPFEQLVQTYTMDGNSTGDFGWIREDYIDPEFAAVVKSHKKGEIFTVDIPTRKWYHVVLKTHDESYIKILTILRIKNG